MSRSSGNLPAFVQVSADAIAASGTTRPYETLEYSWNFGDPSGTESIYNPVTSGYVNPNTSQVGPEAAYVYRSTGVYTITLNIRGSGSGGYITDSCTTTFTAFPFTPTTNHEFWYDSVSGNNANDGLSSGSPKETLDHLEYAFGASGYLHFARGGQYNLRSGVNAYYRTGLRVDAYGSGAKPVLKCCYASGVEAGVQILIGSNPSHYYDSVWSNVEFRNMGLSSSESNRTIFHSISTGPDTSITDTYFDNCEINRSVDYPISGVFGGIQRTSSDSNFGLWKCSFNAGTGLYDYISGEYLGGEQLGDVDHEWTFFIGVAMSGGVGKADALGRATTHNIYTGSENHQLYRYCQLGADARDRLFCINGNINGFGNSGVNFEGASGDPSVCRYWNISDNEFTGMWGAIDLGNQNNNSWTSGSIDDVVIEKNNIHDMSNMSDPPWPPTSGSQATYGSGINWANNDSWTLWWSAGKNFTIRNNDFDPNLPRSTPKVASDIFAKSTYGSPRIYDNIVGNIVNGTGYYVNPLLLSDNTTVVPSGWEYNNFPEGYLNNLAIFTGDTSGSGSEDGSAITGDLNVSDALDGMTSPNFTITSSPVHGSGSINSSNGLWSYTPSADYNGSDSFTVRATDDLGNTETQVISLTISSIVDIANNIDTTNQNTPVTTSVLANDSFEGTPVITSVTQGSNGTVTTNGTTTTYTPNTNFYGSDSYTYTVTSGGVTETATVNITVNQVSSGPPTMFFIAANNLIFTFMTG